MATEIELLGGVDEDDDEEEGEQELIPYVSSLSTNTITFPMHQSNLQH